jgi:hypothetical protein
MTYTPEFQDVFVLLSSPAASLAVLWCVTTNVAVQGMRSTRRLPLLQPG